MATSRFFDRLRRGIGPRLLVRVLVFSVVSTLVLTLSQLYLDYRRDTQDIDRRMSEIADSYGHSLGEGLWNLDRRQLELQIEGILRLPAVRFVEVRETTDRSDPMVVSGGAHTDPVQVSHRFPLYRPGRGEQQQLGVLRLEATFDDVYSELREKAIVILTSQGATIFVVSLFVLFLTHRLVTRHLTALAGFLRHYDVLRPPPPLVLQRRPPAEKDELDDVVAAFETMRRTLEQAYANLRASEQLLRDYAETASDWFWATGRRTSSPTCPSRSAPSDSMSASCSESAAWTPPPTPRQSRRSGASTWPPWSVTSPSATSSTSAGDPTARFGSCRPAASPCSTATAALPATAA
jgi:HAMP domain-containing protein